MGNYYSHKNLLNPQPKSIYPSGASLAWEFDRVPPGYESYTGPLEKLRRSDGIEEIFYMGANPGELNTVYGGGGTDYVTWRGSLTVTMIQVYFADGSGNSAYFGTVSRQPIVAISGVDEMVNGRISPKWNTASLTNLFLASSISAAEDWTMAVIFKRSAPGTIFYSIAGGIYSYGYVHYSNNKIYARSRSGYLESNSAYNDNDHTIGIVTMAGGTRKIRKNGNEIPVTFTASSNSANLTDIGGYDNAGEWSSAWIQGIFFWNSNKHSKSSQIEKTANKYYEAF